MNFGVNFKGRSPDFEELKDMILFLLAFILAPKQLGELNKTLKNIVPSSASEQFLLLELPPHYAYTTHSGNCF